MCYLGLHHCLNCTLKGSIFNVAQKRGCGAGVGMPPQELYRKSVTVFCSIVGRSLWKNTNKCLSDCGVRCKVRNSELVSQIETIKPRLLETRTWVHFRVHTLSPPLKCFCFYMAKLHTSLGGSSCLAQSR